MGKAPRKRAKNHSNKWALFRPDEAASGISTKIFLSGSRLYSLFPQSDHQIFRLFPVLSKKSKSFTYSKKNPYFQKSSFIVVLHTQNFNSHSHWVLCVS
jgi:hypothetical protein